MKYKELVDLLRETASDVLESHDIVGMFYHARRSDANLQNTEQPTQIHLYPFDLTRPGVGDPETANILMGFYRMDVQDSTELAREIAVGGMDELCNEFLALLDNSEDIVVSNIRREPNYHVFDGVFTGMLLSMSIQSATELC